MNSVGWVAGYQPQYPGDVGHDPCPNPAFHRGSRTLVSKERGELLWPSLKAQKATMLLFSGIRISPVTFTLCVEKLDEDFFFLRFVQSQASFLLWGRTLVVMTGPRLVWDAQEPTPVFVGRGAQHLLTHRDAGASSRAFLEWGHHLFPSPFLLLILLGGLGPILVRSCGRACGVEDSGCLAPLQHCLTLCWDEEGVGPQSFGVGPDSLDCTKRSTEHGLAAALGRWL